MACFGLSWHKLGHDSWSFEAWPGRPRWLQGTRLFQSNFLSMSRHICKRDQILSLFFIVLGLRCHCPLRAAGRFKPGQGVQVGCKVSDFLRVSLMCIYIYIPLRKGSYYVKVLHYAWGYRCHFPLRAAGRLKPDGQGVQVGCRASDFRRVTLIYVQIPLQKGIISCQSSSNSSSCLGL